MKKFRFRLETVERHRKIQEQERQVWLTKCLEKMRATERKLLDLDRKEVDARKEFAGLGTDSQSTPGKFWMLDQFIKGQKVRRLDLKKELQEQEQEVALASRGFLNARQQRKILEKLHEKDHDKYQDEVARHELHQQDELYTMRARPIGIAASMGEDKDEE